MNTKTKSRKDVYAIITEKIIEKLEEGTVPWRKPWIGAGIPTNLISKRPYRGINVMLLSMLGYEHNLFLTSKQLNEIGGSIKEEEKPHLVVFWNYPEQEGEEDEAPKKKPMLRYYTVFNIAQCDGIPDTMIPSIDREVKANAAAKVLVNNMPNAPRIQHKEQEAYYNPLKDFINMPKQSSFKTDDAYYSTLFHELVHSTGHVSRLNRKDLIQMSEFGHIRYSHEELVAEIGSSFLQSHVGITDEFEQSVAYINGWLAVLKKDRRFIFSASTAAQKAVDYILGVTENE
ncbi:MAG: DUF1738 domain-containing protein [Chitinophagales bacterium]|nr:DUF1738 domain-containing protein [Chitinophagales bacterium]